MFDLKVGDKVIYRGLGSARLEATIEYVYPGECTGELALTVDTGSGPELIERVPAWDGRPEHYACWQRKPA